MARDNITARDKLVAGESLNVVVDKSGSKEDTPASKEKTKEASTQTRASTFLWHRDKRDLIQPANFIGLLPAAGSCKAKGILLMLSCLELYQEAFTFTLQRRLSESSQQLLSPRDMVLHDDVNTAYEITSTGGGSTGGGSNSTGVSFHFFSVTPALHPEAQELVIEIPYMEMHHHQAGHVEVLSLSGPWEIRVQLPSRDSVV